VSDDGKFRVVSERDDKFVDHKTEDTHHGSPSVVKLNSTLLELGLLVEAVPAEVNVSITEVTRELSESRNLAHEGTLEDTDEGDDLHNSGSGDVVRAEDGSNTVGVAIEGLSGVVDGSRKVDSGTGDDLAKEGKLGDTSVLDFDVSEAFEALGGGVSGEHAEGIEETQRGLSTKFVLEGHLGADRGASTVLGRGESGGTSDERGGDDSLHGFKIDVSGVRQLLRDCERERERERLLARFAPPVFFVENLRSRGSNAKICLNVTRMKDTSSSSTRETRGLARYSK